MKSVLPKPMELELEKGASNPSESAALKIENRNNAQVQLMNQFGGNKKRKRKTNKRKSNNRKINKRKTNKRKTNKRRKN